MNPCTNAAGLSYPPWPAKTEARIATPNTPPSSRNALLAPDATPACSGGTEPMIALATVGKQNEVPIPETVKARPRSR